MGYPLSSATIGRHNPKYAPECPQVLRGSQVSTDSAVMCLGEGTADVAFLFYEDLNVL